MTAVVPPPGIDSPRPTAHGGLNALWVVVSIVSTLVATGLAIYGASKPSASELDQARSVNEMLRQEVVELQRDAPARERKLREDLASTQDQVFAAQSQLAELRDRVKSLDSELASERQHAAAQSVAAEAAEKRIRELTNVINQDRPTIIATADLKQGAKYTFRVGMALEYTGIKDDMITLIVDDSRRFGIPMQALTQLFSLRFHQALGTVVGIQPLTLLDRQRTLQINLVQFPAKWAFAPVAQ